MGGNFLGVSVETFDERPIVDPGFPRDWGANPPGRAGAPTYNFAKFSQKLHKIDRIWRIPPLGPPDIISLEVTFYCCMFSVISEERF